MSSTGELDPWRPSPGDPWDHAKAAHLLRRAGFGGTPEELDAVVALGMDRTVDLLLAVDRRGLREFGTVVLPHGEAVTLGPDLRGHRALWLFEAVHGRFPLREKMALFWHGYFSVGPAGPPETMGAHVNVFRRHGLGRFGDLLIEVTRDPAMLYFLQNYLNGATVGGQVRINENYGRELFELYTMGVRGGYSQRDVVEASKCLSGWTLEPPYPGTRFAYDPTYHVPGPKVVLGRLIHNGSLGREGEKDVYDLVDVLLGHPATATRLVTRIWQAFVSPEPPATAVAELARRLRDDDYALSPLMSTLLRSRAFYATSARRSLVKSPFELVAGAVRNTGRTPVGDYHGLGDRVLLMGQPLLQFATPFGVPGGLAWAGEQAMLARINLAAELTSKWPRNDLRARFDPFREVLRKGLRTAEEIVGHYLDLLVDGAVPAAVRDTLVAFMHRDDAGAAPFRPTPERIDRKVRGLVHLILSLPQYQQN